MPAAPLGGGVEIRQRRIEIADQPRGHRHEMLALGRQQHLAGSPLEQLYPDGFFKLADRQRNGGLGSQQFSRGQLETFELADCDEGTQVPEGDAELLDGASL